MFCVSKVKARDALKLKLESMESKLINGGDVIEKTAKMEKELQLKQRFALTLFFLISYYLLVFRLVLQEGASSLRNSSDKA